MPGYGYRPSVEEVGRTQQDRERTVTSIVERFQGRAPQAAPSGSLHREQRIFQTTETQRHTRFYEGNRRVIRYSSMQEIPPVIVASQRLNRVQVIPLSQSAYNARPQGAPQGQYYNEVPPSYTANNAYAVSYGVDPSSAISRCRQLTTARNASGSTNSVTCSSARHRARPRRRSEGRAAPGR